MKKIVTIVIIAALVLAAFIALAGNVKADSTSEATVVSYSRYIAPSNPTFGGPQGVQPGDLIVVGEVKNVGGNVITNVTVQGIALDGNGQTLATSRTQAFVYYMLPSQKSPFYLDFGASSSSTQDLSWVSSVNSITVTVTSVQDTNARQYAGISLVSNVNYTDYSGVYIVRGTIENTGNQIAAQPWAVTTFYNAAGTVISMNFTNYLISSLSPGGAYLFFATPVDNNTALTSQITDYTCQIDSLTLANSASSTSTPTSTSTASTSPASQFPTLLVAIIVVVLVVVIIAALMLVRRGKKLPLPPPPPTE